MKLVNGSVMSVVHNTLHNNRALTREGIANIANIPSGSVSKGLTELRRIGLASYSAVNGERLWIKHPEALPRNPPQEDIIKNRTTGIAKEETFIDVISRIEADTAKLKKMVVAHNGIVEALKIFKAATS